MRQAAASFGFRSLAGTDRIVFPWNNHLLTVHLPEQEPPVLAFESTMRERLAFSDIAAVAATINSWNHDRLGPTASLTIGDNGEIECHARSAVLIGVELSDEQLADHVRLGIETTILLARELVQAHPLLDGSQDPNVEKLREKQDNEAVTKQLGGVDKQLSAEDVGLNVPVLPNPEGVTMTADLPEPVTIARIRDTLHQVGITKTSENAEADTLIAWINSILFGFFIDNGPSYLVKGHWDPDLDENEDFLRIFLLCNEWNEDQVTTKAYTHTNDTGLQVRVEFTVSVAAGLNDAQLAHNTAVAINTILSAIDSISTQATGSGAVEWPPSDSDSGPDDTERG